MSEYTMETHIRNVLIAESQCLALDFAAYIKAQGMQIERGAGYWADKHYFMVKYKDEYVCFILVNGYGSARHPDESEGWMIWSDDSGKDWFAGISPDESTKETAWKHIDFCGHCGCCEGGRRRIIFGREFDAVCRTAFRFDNPNAKEVECAKKLMGMRKNAIEIPA